MVVADDINAAGEVAGAHRHPGARRRRFRTAPKEQPARA
jgi:hypothetical protein